MTDFERANIKQKHFRVVRNSKRKRLLQKRGEHIWWSCDLNAWIWDYTRIIS